MYKWLLSLLVVCSAAASLAEPAVPVAGQEAVVELTREQRRMELRNVLSANRRSERSAPVADASAAGRQLSSQERAEMREQLRQYQFEQTRARP